MLGLGEVRHTRLKPVRHGFAYPTFFVLLPMRQLRLAPDAALPRNRFGLISFQDRDHGDGGPDSLAWLEALLAREGITDAQGEVWLHCFPRVLGYAFKPVSFWYCHRADQSLAAIVVEVNNTFGERHVYLLAGASLGWGRELEARKVFHVSPFCKVEGRYRFRFFRNETRTVARIEHDDDLGPLLLTSVCGQLHPVSRTLLLRTFFRMPFLTLGVMLRIHLQALRLWRLHLPFFSKPDAPATAVSRGVPLA